MPLVQTRNLSKAFGETKALNAVSLELQGGEVHALLGENGAGKSTFVKILSGVLVPDDGAVEIDGQELQFGSARHAATVGVSTAFQELSLLPNLTVAQALLLPDLPRGPMGLVSRRASGRQARRILEAWSLETPVDAEVGTLDLATKQRLEIVRSLSREPKLLILDEPTAALADTGWLFAHIATVIARGTAVLYISHRLSEIRQICHRGTVLRNGRVVGGFTRDDFNEDAVIAQMIGRSLEATFPARRGEANEEVALRVRGLSVGSGVLQGADLDVHRGEVVGVAALEGQGQRDLFYALYGVRRSDGTVEVDGKPVRVRSPRAALRAGSGIALVPEERKVEALFLELSARQNITVPILSEVSVGPLIAGVRERRRAAQEARRLNIDPAVLERPVGRLSGGNQQKVVLAKMLLTGAKVLLLFDPTRGIDAATKVEIYELIRELADAGTSVLIYSTEIPELVGLCDRVYALYEGRITGQFAGDTLTEDNLLSAAIGHRRNGGAGAERGKSSLGAETTEEATST